MNYHLEVLLIRSVLLQFQVPLCSIFNFFGGRKTEIVALYLVVKTMVAFAFPSAGAPKI